MTAINRLSGDRIRREWAICEEIAARPGQARLDLARAFHVSERQVQADLGLIRTDMRLPLVRDGGYRFRGEGTFDGPNSLRVRDVLLLVQLMARGRTDWSVPRDDLESLGERLPQLFPPHLQPLAARALKAERADTTFVALATALVRGSSVRLAYPDGARRFTGSAPVVTPELLVPHLDSWLLIADCETTRGVVFHLDGIEAVTAYVGAARAS